MYSSHVSLGSLCCGSWTMSVLQDSLWLLRCHVVLFWLVCIIEGWPNFGSGLFDFVKLLHDLRFFEHLTFHDDFYALPKSLWFWSKAVVCLFSTIVAPEQTKCLPYNCFARWCFVWVSPFSSFDRGACSLFIFCYCSWVTCSPSDIDVFPFADRELYHLMLWHLVLPTPIGSTVLRNSLSVWNPPLWL